jgi:hypothetical protein
MEAAGLEKPTDIAALQAEVQRLQAIVERNEPWFNQNAALLAAHNIGGFTFAEGKQDGK